MMSKIGLAEDDVKIADLVANGLREQGFDVTVIANGLTALETFGSADFDLVILDVMMPGLSGVAVCEQLRVLKPTLPILLLTALGSLDDKVIGFDAGADDYLVKPFHFKELLIRISALLRRNLTAFSPTDSELITYDGVVLNKANKEVHRDGQLIPLTAKEFVLLELFMNHPNRLLNRQFIAEKAWDINFDTGTNVIDVYVNFLRKKLEKGFARKLIHTKVNMGYIFK